MADGRCACWGAARPVAWYGVTDCIGYKRDLLTQFTSQ